MNGNIFASSLSASTIVLTANLNLANHSALYAVVCDNGCTQVTLPSLVIVPTGAVPVNGRMFLIRNISSGNVTVATQASGTLDGFGSTMSLRPNQWVIVHGQNDTNRWQVYRPDSPGVQTIDVTYAQLMNLVGSTAATGTTSGFYRITDYQTRGFIIGGSGAAYTGILEPLIVSVYYNSAMGTTAQISREAFSPRFPDDIIHYDPFPQNWYTDKSFCTTYDAAGMVSNFKGVIYFRHDLRKNIKGHYDWRYCVMRKVSPASLLIPAWSATAGYTAGDVVYSSGQPWVRIYTGGPTGVALTNTSYWLPTPPLPHCAVSPYNNENLSPAGEYRWDLCTNNYAHSGTGSTFSCVLPLDLADVFDRTTFDTSDPSWVRDIDLGSFNWNLGESLIPHPNDGGASAASMQRKYGTIVTQNHLSESSLGVFNGGVGFNRLMNISLGPRAWGNYFSSAGFIDADNDTQNIHFTDRCEFNQIYPFPAFNNPSGSTSVNVGAGMRNVRGHSVVNCAFFNGVLDCDFNAIRDTWVYYSANIRTGNANALGPWEYVSGATDSPTPPRGFSTGNIFIECANVGFDQVRWSLLKNVTKSKFADVHKVYLLTTVAEGMDFSGDFRLTTMLNNTVFGTKMQGHMTNCYFNEGSLLSNTFAGHVYGNKFDSWTIERNVLMGEFTGVGASASGSYFAVNTCMGDMIWGPTAPQIVMQGNYFTQQFGLTGSWNSWTPGLLFSGNKVHGTMWGNFMDLGFSKNVVLGDILDNNITQMNNVQLMSGMTGATGVNVQNAVVIGTGLDGLDMSASVHGPANVSKLYGVSQLGTQFVARLRDTAGVGSWEFFGATA